MSDLVRRTLFVLNPALFIGCGNDANENAGVELDCDGWDFTDVEGIGNFDDDDENGVMDWEDVGVANDNDLTEFPLPSSLYDGLGKKSTIVIAVEPNEDGEDASLEGIRVWLNDEVILDSDTLEVSLPKSKNDRTLWFEFEGLLNEATFSITGQRKNGAVEVENTFSVMSAPLILNHHRQVGELVVSLSYSGLGGNADFVEEFEDTLGDGFASYPVNQYGWDVWIQDEIEFATLTTENHHMDMVINSIRSGDSQYLDKFPGDNLIEPDVAQYTWGDGRASSQDSFGNLEVTPPLTANGVEYPFGRAYWGEYRGSGPTQALTGMVEEQKVQAPFQLDVSWLCVGHVDEFVTFLPDPTAAQGFKMLVSDVDVGYELLEAQDPTTEIPQYEDDHGYATIGEIVDDVALRALNEELQEDYINPNIEILKEATGVTEADIIRIPGLFEEVGWCGGTTISLMPGTVNMTVVPMENGETHLFMLDPFLRATPNWDGYDPLIDYGEDVLPEDLIPHWLDDWDMYHIMMGEVHCGTNTLRTPAGGWSESASHLLGGDQ